MSENKIDFITMQCDENWMNNVPLCGNVDLQKYNNDRDIASRTYLCFDYETKTKK